MLLTVADMSIYRTIGGREIPGQNAQATRILDPLAGFGIEELTVGPIGQGLTAAGDAVPATLGHPSPSTTPAPGSGRRVNDSPEDASASATSMADDALSGRDLDSSISADETLAYSVHAFPDATLGHAVQDGAQEPSLTGESDATFAPMPTHGAVQGHGPHGCMCGEIGLGAVTDGMPDDGSDTGSGDGAGAFAADGGSVPTPESGGPSDGTQVSSYAWAGQNNIDSLLGSYKWGDGLGTGATLTYSFGTANSVYVSGYSEPTSGFAEFSEHQKTATRQALEFWSDVADITFTEVIDSASVAGDLRFAISNEPSTAWAYTPHSSPYGGDVWVGPNSNYDDMSLGTYGFQTMLHEIGHALGLSHTHQGGTTASASIDWVGYSVMSYKSYAGAANGYRQALYPDTPMANDIAAMQYLYGANTSHNVTDTTYSWTAGESLYEAIWDAGGTDTIDWSNQSTAATINLTAGEWSELGPSYVVDYTSWPYTTETRTLMIAEGAVIENAVGGSGADIITGNTADNTITGGAGNDTLAGGAGNDTFVFDTGFGADIISDFTAGSGSDDVIDLTAFSIVSFSSMLSSIADVSGNAVITLSGNTITLSGVAKSALHADDFVGVSNEGTDGDDTLNGGSDDDTIYGYGGADTISGGAGDDTLIGGAGDDTLSGGDGSDILQGNDGTDTVTYAAASQGVTANLSGTAGSGGASGDQLFNIERLVGSGYDDTLSGNSAANTLEGGAGNDTILAGADADTVNGDAGADILVGGAGGDTIDGGAGNDAIEGGSGDDALTGGTGDDTFQFRTGFGDDTISDFTAGAGSDDQLDLSGFGITTFGDMLDNIADVNGNAVITLSGNTVTLTGVTKAQLHADDFLGIVNGGTSGGDTLTGTGDDDTLFGNAGDDSIDGGAGNDTIDGGTGADAMTGGTGDDTYLVDNAGDTITENASEGTDTVLASVSHSLAANVENLTLTGSSNIDATGNSGDNTLMGNAGDNTLVGGGGADVLKGGNGTDTASYAASASAVTVNLSGNAGSGGDAAGDTLFGVENITGSDYDDTLYGNTVANTLSGGAGDDTLIAGGGADTLYGGAGADFLDGGGNADTMVGGEGNDTYIVNSTSDTITENASEGTDTVYASVNHTLASNVENLTLMGGADIDATGNGAANTLIGNAGDNTLVGGGGADVLKGGNGSDTASYAASASAVTVNLSGIAGSGGNAAGDTLFGVENITGSDYDDTLYGNTIANTLSGGAGDDTILASGGNDTLSGGDGADFLDGGSGSDAMAGGAGNDSYVVDDAGDTIIENASEGTDTVYASASHTLSANVENLTLFGSADIDATGNASDNTIMGNSGDNVLTGGGGADVLKGGNGSDTASYATSSAAVTINLSGIAGTGGDAAGDTLFGIENITGSGYDDTLYGNTIANVLSGGAGADTIMASAGDDTIDGGDGDDNLVGGSGADTLTGGNGSDILSGGSGQDSFAYTAITEAGDLIVDFTAGAGGDSIDVSAMLTSFGYGGADAFGDGYLRSVQNGADTLIRADSDGGGDNFTTIATLDTVTETNLTTDNWTV